jgi:hypothetical protein
MNTPSTPSASEPAERSLREARLRASQLLKDLQSNIRGRVLTAAERLRRLEAFATLPSEKLFARRGTIQRKHALAVVAQEWGYESWAALKADLAAAGSGAPDDPADE